LRRQRAPPTIAQPDALGVSPALLSNADRATLT
jgi:hypothetical protein